MSRRLDVLFVIPGDPGSVYQAGSRGCAIEPPAKARFAASYLMRRGISVDLVDANVRGFDPAKMALEVEERNPWLVVIPVYGFNPSSSTQTMPAARVFALAIKNLPAPPPILMMGTHPAALPVKTARQEPVDFVCSGEGPITIHELLLAIRAGRSCGDISKVRSLVYCENNVTVFGPPAPLINLNAEPVSREAWRLMDPRNYRAHNWHTFWRDYDDRGPYANPYSREGCPFSCSFCNIQAPYRDGESLSVKPSAKSFRSLSPELFLDELTFLVEEFGVKYVKIPDEMFGLGEHPLKIAHMVHDRFGDSLNFWCYFRVDTTKPEELDLLRSAGFRWLGIGIEAANSKVRSGQNKKFGDDRIREIVRQIHGAGIEGGLNYIFGLPGDSHDSLSETYQMAVSLDSAFANFYCNQALPGSSQYADAVNSGYPLPERAGGPGWIGHAQYSAESEPFADGTDLTSAEILAFRDWAHVSYYSRKDYRDRILADSRFGATAMKNIEEQIAGIANLKRKLFGGRSFAELPIREKRELLPMRIF